MTALPLSIEPATLDAWRSAGTDPVVLDVREPWEWDLARLPGTLNIPLHTLPQRLAEVPAEQPVVVMCHHGMRSLNAVHWLRRNGYANTTNLEGGIDAWARQIDPSVGTY